jgi:pimeloyl-ACP methyl ester carboxylesterase
MTRPLVLVHGAWHGPWCWSRVTPLLDAAGVEWHAPELAGPDLHGDAALVRDVLDGVDGAVLVGHSYGGAVITEAGAHPSVAHLVYLAALALDGDETLSSAGGEEAARRVAHETPNLGDFLVDRGDGTFGLAPEAVGPYLYGDCDDATVAWASSRLRPQPAAVFGQSPAAVAWREKPSTYVVCRADRAVPPDLQRLLARRCTASVEWDASHSPFASIPEQTAEFLIALAR